MDAQSRRNSGIRRLALARHGTRASDEQNENEGRGHLPYSRAVPLRAAQRLRPVPSSPLASRPLPSSRIASCGSARTRTHSRIHKRRNRLQNGRPAMQSALSCRVVSCAPCRVVHSAACLCAYARIQSNPIHLESNRIAVRRRRAVDSVRSSRQTGAQVGALTKSHIFQWRALLRRDATLKTAKER